VLDTLPRGNGQRSAFIAEATIAYRLNGDIFDELTRSLALGDRSDDRSRGAA